MPYFDRFIENNIDSESAQANISASGIGRYPIALPRLREQEAITEVLSSLDDKIDLLKRQNKTLESMAEALFRQWFIEEAQDDWEVSVLSELAEVICGKTPSKKKREFYQGPFPFIKIPDLHGETFVSNAGESLSLLGSMSQPKKLLPPYSILVSCIATVGVVSMNLLPSHTNQQINALVPRRSEYRYVLYCFCKSIYTELQVLAGGGTAILNLNTGDFGRITLNLPTNDRVMRFHCAVEDWFQKIEWNTKEISLLERKRDTLLPKLMSGEVRVRLD
jgi:type I restriction enzyme S subunit